MSEDGWNLPKELARCEVCGDPTTLLVSDFQQVPNPSRSYYITSPVGDVHHFCAQHSRDSIIEQVPF